jgi:translation initiation factor IF-1
MVRFQERAQSHSTQESDSPAQEAHGKQETSEEARHSGVLETENDPGSGGRSSRTSLQPSSVTGKTRGCMAKNDDKLRMEGTIVKALPGTQFMVELDNGHEILAYLAGKMRKYYIRVLLGDRVTVEMSTYDLTRGRIVYRHKKGQPESSPEEDKSD